MAAPCLARSSCSFSKLLQNEYSRSQLHRATSTVSIPWARPGAEQTLRERNSTKREKKHEKRERGLNEVQSTKSPTSGCESISSKYCLAFKSFPICASWTLIASGPYRVCFRNRLALTKTRTSVLRSSPPGAPSVTAMISNGFLSWLLRAGPSKSGWRTFWSSACSSRSP